LQTHLSLKEIICPAFHGVHRLINDGKVSEVWLRGGRGSTKSSFAAIQIILGIIADPNANALVARKVERTLRSSVYTTLIWAITTIGCESLFSASVSPMEITYKKTGQKIIMKGLDDPLKLKSIKARRGYFKFLWFEEASEFKGMDEIRNVEQSVLRGGEKFVEFITYNPPNDPAAWVNKESKIERAARYVHTSNYLDVPHHWLGGPFFKRAEYLKEIDPLKYQHEYMGDAVGRAEQIIFYGKYVEKEFDTPEGVQFFFGADFGFAADPSVLIRCFMLDDCLYIDHEVYGYGVEIDEMPQLYDKIPESRKWMIRGDSARPETISYLARHGFNITAAEKWQGSVEDGIEHLKGFRTIFVHPSCMKLLEEFRNYSYKVDKVTGDILPIIVDDWNHGIDSCRYALSSYIKSRGMGAMWERLGAD